MRQARAKTVPRAVGLHLWGTSSLQLAVYVAKCGVVPYRWSSCATSACYYRLLCRHDTQSGIREGDMAAVQRVAGG